MFRNEKLGMTTQTRKQFFVGDQWPKADLEADLRVNDLRGN